MHIHRITATQSDHETMRMSSDKDVFMAFQDSSNQRRPQVVTDQLVWRRAVCDYNPVGMYRYKVLDTTLSQSSVVQHTATKVGKSESGSPSSLVMAASQQLSMIAVSRPLSHTEL